jgi:hypothetical protein
MDSCCVSAEPRLQRMRRREYGAETYVEGHIKQTKQDVSAVSDASEYCVPW